MPNAYRIHVTKPGRGRPRKDGKVRTWCGYYMPANYIGEPNCTRCLEYVAAAQRVPDEATLEAARLVKRLYNRQWRKTRGAEGLAKDRERYYRNRERYSARRKETYRICREHDQKRHREWNMRNREHVREYNRRYRAMKAAAAPSLPHPRSGV